MDQSEEPAGNIIPKKYEKVVYIFNMSEDVWPFICSMSDPHARQFEIDWNANLSERDIIAIPKKTKQFSFLQTLFPTVSYPIIKKYSGIKKLPFLFPRRTPGKSVRILFVTMIFLSS